jgi:hypothetical protein
MLEWGLVAEAGRHIETYFGKFVRDDGSLLYRGPETGQYGRMLTVVAQYINYGGAPQVLLRQRSRIDGVTKLLLGLREKAKALPSGDPAYGMLAGWSEADASLDPEPQRYMQPYFSNSTEAARGFRDLGRVWEKIGKQRKNSELIAWGPALAARSRRTAQRPGSRHRALHPRRRRRKNPARHRRREGAVSHRRSRATTATRSTAPTAPTWK